MRARLWIVAVLAVAAPALLRAADEPEPSAENQRASRVEGGIDFAIRAAMGNISDPRIRKLAGNSAAGAAWYFWQSRASRG